MIYINAVKLVLIAKSKRKYIRPSAERNLLQGSPVDNSARNTG